MQWNFHDTVFFHKDTFELYKRKKRKKQYYRRRSDDCAEDVDGNDGKKKRTRLRHLKTRLGPIILSSDERRAHRSCTRRKSVTRRFYVTVTRLTRFRFPAVYFKRYRGHWPLTWPERFYDFTALRFPRVFGICLSGASNTQRDIPNVPFFCFSF